MITTLNVHRANCPNCFAETLDTLRRLDGVRSVQGSFDGPCIEIDHDGVDTEVLTAAVSSHLHGVEMLANEIVMVPVDAAVALRCAHGRANPAAATTTLAELVNRAPQTIGVLERLGLDFCCGGGQSIAAAATDAGLDLGTVLQELADAEFDADTTDAATPEAQDWLELSPAALAEHVEQVHHRYLWDTLPGIQVLVDRIANVHGSRHPELAEVRRLFGELRADLEPHLRSEETSLFPLIGETGASTAELGELLDALTAEHEVVGDLLRELRTVSDGYRVPDDGCASYEACFRALAELEADTHLHVHKENNVLWPAVRAELAALIA